jgi:quercetin dioxygenase-like cupin family protein
MTESKAEPKPLRRAGPQFRWEDVDHRPYKEADAAPFKAISRQTLFSDPRLLGELRYFEIAPGGYSTLERHEHMHAVMILRGQGSCLVGTAVHTLGPYDLVTIAPFVWHQFRATAGVSLGFLCLVDSVRDRPQLPTPADRAALRSDPAIAAFLDGQGQDGQGQDGQGQDGQGQDGQGTRRSDPARPLGSP